jgi:hypothetical protein
MNEIGKGLIYIGAFFIVIGAMVLILGKLGIIGKLPGDIYIKRDNYSFYFPIVTCLIISLILSLIFYFLRR